MILSLSKDQFRNLSSEKRFIPFFGEILSDRITPVAAYASLDPLTHRFLLESVVGGESWGRFSYVGGGVLFRFEGNVSEGLSITDLTRSESGGRCHRDGDLLTLLKDEMEAISIESSLLPAGLAAGIVGYLSYDMVREFEKLPSLLPPQKEFPDLYFVLPEFLLVFDHVLGKLRILTWIDREEDLSSDELYDKASSRLSALKGSLSFHADQEGSVREHDPLSFVESPSSRVFEENVLKAKEHIKSGDIFQIVLSKRFSFHFDGDPLKVYRVLRSINPSPYMYLIQDGDMAIVGSSPELLVRVKGEKVEVRPIAGTVRRTGVPEEDAIRQKQLLADPKELAEHVMLVDLGRNDVGRVSQPGTVRVPEMMVLEQYSHVTHIVSHVEGLLSSNNDAFSVIRAAFPAGTLSGAPKIRAMQIIESLETMRRGPYAGAVGTISFSGDCDLAIAIRSIFIRGGNAFLQAGAGIVADSIPQNEDQEVAAKAAAMMEALRISNGERGSWLF
ncbi:anthranilate synthase component I family protein [Leptospirillum ferrooxidans]|uniref:Anthranilate synthase component 1 n=1 Tax=Leptospirillum ferrooxidans (strain C2-3) TaxID=1162668 RepID=I0IM99_LEPFC|nr:chorismate-binding protein [Leptospirillum ferrooxidans]BAM06398.1 putative anthranilate synthase component I [Leptospirillum ferrooxidans C2-3]